MLTCPSCGNEEPEGTRFCGNCGTPFAPADEEPEPTAAVTGSEAMVTCPSCGNEEPEGTRFCGSCGTPFAPADEPPAHALTPEAPVEEPPEVEPGPPPAPAGERSRLRWVVAGTAVALLLAAGATVAVLSLTGDDGTTEAVTTEETLPTTTTTTETLPPASTPTLADSVSLYLAELSASQAALNTRLRSIQADAASVAALRDAATALAADVVRTQGFLDGVAPNDATEASTLSLLRSALAAHLVYANTLASLPSQPQALTDAQVQAAVTRAEQARRAYVSVTAADPALPIVHISGSDHTPLLAVVHPPTPPPSTPARHEIDLAPLLVGIRPDDPPGEGRCFGPYTARASLTVSGVVHRSGFVQCGDDANGDPSRASGVYRFSGSAVPNATLARLTAQAAIDESSSSSQRGSSVTWTVFYAETPICSTTVVWGGSRPTPKKLDCRIPSAGTFDVRRLRIEQIASLSSTGDFWAGLLNPTLVVTST